MFFAYLKEKRNGVVVFCLFAAVFLAAFALYHLPLAAVLYPIAVCGVLGMIVLLCSYVPWLRRRRTLQQLLQRGGEALSRLPEAGCAESEDYQALLRLLQQEQRNASDAADRRYQDMVEYYTVWAHQIKTPIAAMRLRLQEEDSDLARQLRTDLGRIEQYAEMVLTFLRLDSDSTDYVFRSVELDGILRQTVRKFSGEFIGRHLTLDLANTGKTVVTDEKWLSFVLEQVLSNALKYTKSGGIRIAMEGVGTLAITDTGIGIAADDLPRIFEKGYTGFNGRTDKKASGIGLYLCRRICANLGIRIAARSAVGEGTTICLTFSDKQCDAE